MSARVLITGGAGFIGSHVADEFLAHGYAVRALDNLEPQVHGGRDRPDYLDPEVELIRGDINDRAAVDRALRGVDAVIHLAAVVGVGQSMYEIIRYTTVNSLGTATLLEALSERPVGQLVVASSMSIYGEGLYRDRSGRLVEGRERPIRRLRAHDWQVRDGGEDPLMPVPTPESKRPALPSVYAVSKFHQERLCLSVGAAYGMATVALRLFNTYGPRQALSNPYTGVLAIFASRLLNGKPPLVNEDGHQRRDFVEVRDVARAFRLAVETPEAAGRAINIGSGEHWSIREIASKIARVLGKEDIAPRIVGEYRMGDIRNCFADITLARSILDYHPRTGLEDGLAALAEWLEGQTAVDRVPQAERELVEHGLKV